MCQGNHQRKLHRSPFPGVFVFSLAKSDTQGPGLDDKDPGTGIKSCQQQFMHTLTQTL